MALFKKKEPDPISERARTLNAEIAALESKIKRLDAQLHQRQSQPRLRSTAVPHGGTITHGQTVTPPPPSTKPVEPVFEDVGKKLLETPAEKNGDAATHFNEMGVRKYDLPGLIKRVRDSFKRPTASNPRLVSYLAAGGVHGLRPMRYEKRVARNRFIAFTILLLIALIGILYTFLRNR